MSDRPKKHDYASMSVARHPCALCQEVKSICACCGVCKQCNGRIHDHLNSRAHRESGNAGYVDGRLL